MKIDIESAMRLRNPQSDLEPPNAFVSLALPYPGCEPQQIKSQVVFKSSYPAWHLINQQVKFNLSNDVLRHLIEYPLEFEVYHSQQLASQTRTTPQLLGVAYVDLSQMVYLDNTYQIGGYFHIVRRDRFKDAQALSIIDPHRMSMESLGQIKLGITSNTNLRRTASNNPLTRSLIRENSPINRVQEHQLIMAEDMMRSS